MAGRGRGRLNSIELLPEEAAHIVAWAHQELKERSRTQVDIHTEFNERLAEIELGPISLSAFNRASTAIASMARRQHEIRTITSTLAERMEPGDADELTVMAAEAIKMTVYELLLEPDTVTPKAAMELSRALQSAVNAQKMPLDRKRAQLAAFEQKVDGALDKVATETGMGAERIAEIKRNILGLTE